mgnify:CR=1 FL=1
MISKILKNATKPLLIIITVVALLSFGRNTADLQSKQRLNQTIKLGVKYKVQFPDGEKTLKFSEITNDNWGAVVYSDATRYYNLNKATHITTIGK